MALEYNDDLKAAVRNIEASMELERAARADRTPTLSAGADFKYTGNPLELSAELPGVGPLTFEGQDLNYGASVTLLQPVYTGGRIIEAIRLAESQTLVAEAEQELQEGPLAELSGPSLAMMKLAMRMKQVVVVAWFTSIFIPWGEPATIGVTALVGAVVFLVKWLVDLVVCGVLQNSLSRSGFNVVGIAVLAFVFVVVGV